MSIALANIRLWKLQSNSNAEAQDAEDYRVTCDDCAILIDEDTYGENDGLCLACNAAVHFTCKECEGVYHLDDRHVTYTTLCDECGDAKRTEVADGLWALIEDLAGSWSGEDDEISKLQKLLKYAKKLK